MSKERNCCYKKYTCYKGGLKLKKRALSQCQQTNTIVLGLGMLVEWPLPFSCTFAIETCATHCQLGELEVPLPVGVRTHNPWIRKRAFYHCAIMHRHGTIQTWKIGILSYYGRKLCCIPMLFSRTCIMQACLTVLGRPV